METMVLKVSDMAFTSQGKEVLQWMDYEDDAMLKAYDGIRMCSMQINDKTVHYDFSYQQWLDGKGE